MWTIRQKDSSCKAAARSGMISLSIFFHLLLFFSCFCRCLAHLSNGVTKERGIATTLSPRAWMDEYACDEAQTQHILRTIPKLRMLAFLSKEASRARNLQHAILPWPGRESDLFQRHFGVNIHRDAQSRDMIHGYFRDIYFETDFSRSLYLVRPEAAQDFSERRQVRIQCQRNVGRCHNNLDGAYVSLSEEYVVIVRSVHV